ncbi:GH24487 [Drosophila grimshawi]|uniref:GH24487 n=2 Tax=Drosophila grimshawi TaxID=7222 RepID=B4JLN2_DROGR|nr:GH24487 [Drosophila grimshawi]
MRTLSLIALIFVAGVTAVVAAGCELQVKDPRPIIVKRFGSKTAIVRRALDRLNMFPNETTTFHCPTGINFNSVNSRDATKLNVATAELLCTEEGLFLGSNQIIQQPRTSGIISCSGGFSKRLYESNSSLIGCSDDQMTLVVGYRLQGLPDVKILGICYDLSAMRFRFVSFLASAATNLLLELNTENELNDVHLDVDIGSLSTYFRFPTQSEFKQIQQQPQHDLGDLFDAKLFEYDSLLQDPEQKRKLSAYGDMLSIVWLRSLRSGNWRHFLSALRNTHVDFDVRLGVSDIATLPLAYNCNATRPLQFVGSTEDSSVPVPVPKYIWAHVRSLYPTDNVHDEFVVVAHNSPYANVLELSSFCADICSEITWLSDTLFGQLHLVPNYGVMHCCRPDQLNKLTDFPRIEPPPPPPPPTILKTTTPSTVLL